MNQEHLQIICKVYSKEYNPIVRKSRKKMKGEILPLEAKTEKKPGYICELYILHAFYISSYYTVQLTIIFLQKIISLLSK